MTDSGAVSWGDAALDEALEGGLPRQRPTLVIGEPGVGKTTLAMQFLQEGLAHGEDCLFVSTEQTRDELRDTFSAFDFDMDAANLTVTSVHAVPGETIESTEEDLVLATFEDGEAFGDGFAPAFTPRRVRQWLRRYAPQDRVVLDSVSGLRATSDGTDNFRRCLLDVVRLFSDGFGATTVLTAEGSADVGGDPDPIAFTPHGVVRLWQESVHGERHRFLRVEKMRGVDHDTRRFKLRIDEGEGVQVVPRRRAMSPTAANTERFSTGVEGLDELLGGGLPFGDLTLVEHDGIANIRPVVVAVLNRALATGKAVSVLPPVDFDYQQFDEHLHETNGTMADLLNDDRVFVIDPIRPPYDSHRNVFHVDGPEAYEAALESTYEQRGDTSLVSVIDVDTLLDTLPPKQVEQIGRRATASLLTSDDTVVAIYNTNSTNEGMRVFLEDICQQVLRVTQDEDGMQIASLRKAETAEPGRSRVLEFVDDYPYVRLA